jgi:hypothetical protein
MFTTDTARIKAKWTGYMGNDEKTLNKYGRTRGEIAMY